MNGVGRRAGFATDDRHIADDLNVKKAVTPPVILPVEGRETIRLMGAGGFVDRILAAV